MQRWLLLLGVCACNEIYGLDETKVRPSVVEPPDTDHDGEPDPTDVCPGVADPGQADRDHDGFGDACDFCPDASTAVNHDEDADSHGDACDRCPAIPDFQADQEGDGVGDFCDDDSATQNRFLLFDPFLELGDVWEQTGVWSMFGDAVTSDSGARLHAPSIEIDGTASFAVDIGVTIVSAPAAGDQFGLELVDNGVVVASCFVTCSLTSSGCRLEITPAEAQGLPQVEFVPLASLTMRRNPVRLACVYGAAVATDETTLEAPSFPRATVRLVGSPKVRFRYVAIRQ